MAAAAHGPSLSSSASQSVMEVLAMNKGDGEESYSKNSALQETLANDFALGPNFDQALQKANFPARGEPILIADLGCSSGPNTIRNVTRIIEKIICSRISDSASPAAPEFQVFFNDLPSNDFNNLFQLFSSEIKLGNFFPVGVPGSFHGRLFPRSTVHLFFSASAVHFLSKIPDAVSDRNSSAFNKGHLWIEGSNAATLAAYKEQSSSDLKNFLHARAAELAPGGLLYFVTKAEGHAGIDSRKENVEVDPMEILVLTMSKIWRELESEGIITEGQTESFNFPACFRTMEEILEDIQAYSSDFEVHIAKTVKMPKALGCLLTGPTDTTFPSSRSAFCIKVRATFKGAIGDLVDKYIGKETSQILWDRFDQLLEKEMVPYLLGDSNMNIIALIRKG